MAITSKRIEIFWILDKILKALIEADRMVPLSRVYDLDFMDFENFNEKKTYRKKTYPVTFFSGRGAINESSERLEGHRSAYIL